ncbi:MAG: glycosyltransferase family 2 protein [Chitinophagaceae bacterium]
MDLSIIIINYKSAKLVVDCIESIVQQTTRYSYEVILVDNFSEDDCYEKAKAVLPSVKWVQTGYNAGFARANNAGIKQAGGDYILLLNADTIVLDGALDKTIDLLKQDDAVACGVQLLNADGTHQISGAHFVKGGLNFLLPLPYFGRFVRYWGYKLKTRVPSITSVEERQPVDWIVGAFIMVKKEPLAKAGLLDDDFFMYAEEIEWCARLRKQGSLVLYATPQVIHLGGGTSSDYYDTTETENSKNLWNRKGRQIIISMMVRIRKQYGIGWYLLMVAFYVAEIPIFFVGLLIEKIFKRKARYTWVNFADYVKNVGCLLKYFFTIAFNRPYFYKVA